MEASDRPIRLRELAEASGLSVSGVSRALNGDPTMARETRERIRALAERLGYRVNPAAKSLREAGASSGMPFRGTIAYIISRLEDQQMRARDARSQFWWHFEISDRASRHGYTVDTFILEPGDPAAAHVQRVLYARGIRGIILSAHHRDPREYGIEWENYAAVSLSALPTAHFLHNLSVPYFQDTYDAAQRLTALGYRRIGFLMVGNVLDPFLGGYEVALQRSGLELFPVLRSECGVPAESVRWIKKHRLDAVLTTSGLDVVEAIQKARLRIPQDVGICVIDDIDKPGFLSGMQQPRRQLSRWAVDSLHNMLTHNEIGPPLEPVEIQFPSRWSPGNTVRTPPEPGSTKSFTAVSRRSTRAARGTHKL